MRCKCYQYHTYNNNPFKGNIQSYTCKSYTDALFLAYNSSPLKGNIQSCTCKSYLEAFSFIYINSPLKGEFLELCMKLQRDNIIHQGPLWGDIVHTFLAHHGAMSTRYMKNAYMPTQGLHNATTES